MKFWGFNSTQAAILIVTVWFANLVLGTVLFVAMLPSLRKKAEKNAASGAAFYCCMLNSVREAAEALSREPVAGIFLAPDGRMSADLLIRDLVGHGGDLSEQVASARANGCYSAHVGVDVPKVLDEISRAAHAGDLVHALWAAEQFLKQAKEAATFVHTTAREELELRTIVVNRIIQLVSLGQHGSPEKNLREMVLVESRANHAALAILKPLHDKLSIFAADAYSRHVKRREA